ncbi:hypothetical protein VTI74DRAFT_10028 [Chaetomium olivicolor]
MQHQDRVSCVDIPIMAHGPPKMSIVARSHMRLCQALPVFQVAKPCPEQRPSPASGPFLANENRVVLGTIAYLQGNEAVSGQRRGNTALVQPQTSSQEETQIFSYSCLGGRETLIPLPYVRDPRCPCRQAHTRERTRDRTANHDWVHDGLKAEKPCFVKL